MAEIHYSQSTAQALKGKVVVMTGGSQGIGGATVALLHSLGSHVYFGDWDDTKGRKVEQDLSSATSSGGSVYFQKLDVRDYNAQVALFDEAYNRHGKVDVAISCAAIGEPGGWFEPEDLNLESVRRTDTEGEKEPVPVKDHIDINLTSVVAFCRIALAYMKSNKPDAQPNGDFSKSIVLVSSIAGITEAPGLFAYSPAKHGVIGLMRALRPWAPLKYGVRANAICPWATDTQILGGVRKKWVEEKMPLNTPEDVARFIVQCAVDKALNGTAVFVSGGRGFDTEEGINRTLPQWMGEQNSVEFLRGQEVLGLAVLSHTWHDGEATFQDFTSPDRAATCRLPGFRKIQVACELALRDDVRYAWVDTCCIDKTSSAEPTEAIQGYIV
ncbi:hypothetical protein jhhlp_006650 [Lomentospora prolificans]|uniref:Heterokaryon incompatibility domain-containing protein n=1 Tax=Lomentospora prolificans TaxID=41688 RepID=A0A2N3N6I3_9PEZI|nr:hypothetical protein jhhlp_006650 [Lomentospora prolificans]